MTSPGATSKQHVSIEMADGVRLAATLYMPEGEGPWPAVIEALPYRKDDITGRSRSEYRRLADAGYVLCRVDVRGTGSSEGIATDEYPLVERTDMAAVIDWLATRPWSLGTVGMYGYSYSGFNSIQIAMERPPALKAIIPIYATDDRFGDDVHYQGGIVKQLDQIDYPSYMVASNALPPAPPIYGDGWREEWARRLEGTEPWVLTWLEHQRLDDYWRHGSLCVDYEAIACPTMIVAGWADGYRNNSFRTFERLRCPKRLVLGPWAHAATDTSLPGPNHDLLLRLTLLTPTGFFRRVDIGVPGSEPLQAALPPETRGGRVVGLEFTRALGVEGHAKDAVPFVTGTLALHGLSVRAGGRWHSLPADFRDWTGIGRVVAGVRGDTARLRYIVANDVDAFLSGGLPYLGIVDTVAAVLAHDDVPSKGSEVSVDDVLEADHWARERAAEAVARHATHKGVSDR